MNDSDDRSSQMTFEDSIGSFLESVEDPSKLRSKFVEERDKVPMRNTSGHGTSASSQMDHSDSFSSFATGKDFSRPGSTRQLLRNVSMGSFGPARSNSSAGPRPVSLARKANSQRNFSGSASNLFKNADKSEENRGISSIKDLSSESTKKLEWESSHLKEDSENLEKNRTEKKNSEKESIEIGNSPTKNKEKSGILSQKGSSSKIFGIRVSSSWKKSSNSTVNSTSPPSSNRPSTQNLKTVEDPPHSEKPSDLLEKLTPEQRDAFLKKEEIEAKSIGSVSVVIDATPQGGSDLGASEDKASLKSETLQPSSETKEENVPIKTKREKKGEREKKEGGCCSIS